LSGFCTSWSKLRRCCCWRAFDNKKNDDDDERENEEKVLEIKESGRCAKRGLEKEGTRPAMIVVVLLLLMIIIIRLGSNKTMTISMNILREKNNTKLGRFSVFLVVISCVAVNNGDEGEDEKAVVVFVCEDRSSVIVLDAVIAATPDFVLAGIIAVMVVGEEEEEEEEDDECLRIPLNLFSDMLSLSLSLCVS